jgi:hypothetical protein
MKRRLASILSGFFFLLLFSPRYVLAQGWFEWGTEGSYVHQTAHLLFAGAMVFFICEIRRERLQQYKGFRCLMWACGILALWNLDAIVGHALDWGHSNRVILGHGLYKRLLMEDPESWFYYLTQIDHFALLIPAFYLFYRGLRAFAQESQPRSR